MSPKDLPSLRSFLKGLIIGLMIISLVILPRVLINSSAANISWTMGNYYNYSGSGSSDLKINFYNTGMPAPYCCTPTATVLTVSVNGYWAQIALIHYQDWTGIVYTCLDDELYYMSGSQIFGNYWDCNGPNLENNWHVLELNLFYQCVHSQCGYWLAWIMDSHQYQNYFVQGNGQFDDEVGPNYNIESYDYTSSDFNNINTHGYMYSNGNEVGTLLYGGDWGANQNPACKSFQTSGRYTGTGGQAPNSVGVVGYLSSYNLGGYHYGAPYEWGVVNSQTYSAYVPITETGQYNVLTYCNYPIS